MSRILFDEIAPRKALWMLCAGLLLAVLPLGLQLAPVAVVLLCACIIGRVLTMRVPVRLPMFWIKVGVGCVGLGGVYLGYRTFVGLDAGISVLLVLISLKVIEARRERDFHVLVFLGWFICLTQMFFGQGLVACAYGLGVAMLLMASLAQAQRVADAPVWQSVGAVVRLAGMAVPLLVVLFVGFPRLHVGTALMFGGHGMGRTGMSDVLSPGSISSLVTSDEVAFRADFLDQTPPSATRLYWRGAVLRRGGGLDWRAGPDDSGEVDRPVLGGVAIRQQIILSPHGGRWVYALDYPAAAAAGIRMASGGVLRSFKTSNQQWRYEVVSRLENRETDLSAAERGAALYLPETYGARVDALVAEWRMQARQPRDYVELAMRYFRTEPFVYTLTPGEYGRGGHSLEQFLFERRRGFCEHYAAAFATLMRLCGVPARVVVGYQGGEMNKVVNFVIVRQSDAHAWCEVWMDGRGWERVDPTDVVAPERLTSGLEAFLASSASRFGGASGAASQSAGLLGVREMVREARMAWDSVQYMWDLHVLNFDEARQRTLLMMAGFPYASAADLMAVSLGGVAICVVVLGGVLMWAGRGRVDAVGRAYARLSRKAGRFGMARDPWEGPEAYGKRLAEAFPARAGEIGRVAELYKQLRYGVPSDARSALRDLERRVSELRLRRG